MDINLAFFLVWGFIIMYNAPPCVQQTLKLVPGCVYFVAVVMPVLHK